VSWSMRLPPFTGSGRHQLPSNHGMTIDKQEDLDALLRAGRVVAETRQAMVEAVIPGITTGELDAVGREVFRRHGARSAPRLTYRFPGSTCISVNDEAAH
jgi:methionyl aminopeptidase